MLVILKYILKISFTDNIILFAFYVTPFPVSPKGEMIRTPSPMGEGQDGGHIQYNK